MAVSSSLEFGGDITHAMEKWMVLEEEEVTFECIARAGRPAAEVTGYVGVKEEVVEEEDTALFDVDTQEEEGDEGLVDVIKTYSFVPSRDDCGKFLKCQSKQLGDDGELLFDEALEVSKQVCRRHKQDLA